MLYLMSAFGGKADANSKIESTAYPTGLPIRSRRWQLFSLRRSDVAEKTATPDPTLHGESDPLIQARTPHVPDASKCSTTKCATVQSEAGWQPSLHARTAGNGNTAPQLKVPLAA